MTDEKTKQEEQPQEENKPKPSVLEETKQAIIELRKEKEEISQIKQELSQLRSDQLLAGSAGGHIEPEKPKELTPAEYAKDVISGKHNEKARE